MKTGWEPTPTLDDAYLELGEIISYFSYGTPIAPSTVNGYILSLKEITV